MTPERREQAEKEVREKLGWWVSATRLRFERYNEIHTAEATCYEVEAYNLAVSQTIALAEAYRDTSQLQSVSDEQKSGFICAKWKKLSDGCVARCDKDHGHDGDHLDSVILIGWSEAFKENSLPQYPRPVAFLRKEAMNKLTPENQAIVEAHHEDRKRCEYGVWSMKVTDNDGRLALAIQNATAQKAIEIAEAESVDSLSAKDESDRAYNQAIEHAIGAIREAFGLATEEGSQP